MLARLGLVPAGFFCHMTDRRYLPCRNCTTYVREQSLRCNVCGVALPHEPLLAVRQRFGPWTDVGRVGGAVFGLLLGSVLAAMILAMPAGKGALAGVSLPMWLLFPLAGLAGWLKTGARGGLRGLGIGVSVSLLFAGVMAGLLLKGLAMLASLIGLTAAGGWLGLHYLAPWAEARFEVADTKALLPTARRHLARLAQLRKDLAHIAEVRRNLTRSQRGDVLVKAGQALDAAEVAITHQMALYTTEVWRVELGQWQAAVEPVLQMVRPGPRPQVEATAKALADACHDLQRKRERWKVEPEAETPRGKAVLQLAGRLWQACDHVRDSLVLELAAQLAAGAPGIAEAVDSTGHWHEVQLGNLPELQRHTPLPDLSDLGELDDLKQVLLSTETDLRHQMEALHEVERLAPTPVDDAPALHANPFARDEPADVRLARPKVKPAEHRSELDEDEPGLYVAPQPNQPQAEPVDTEQLLDELLAEVGKGPSNR
jgi:hypothetical protein